MKRYFVLVAFLVLTNVVYASTPTVTGVSGTIATGNTLTITGTNMVQENSANWLISPSQGSFEGANAGADGYSYGSNRTNYGTYVSDVKLLGNQSARFHVAGACSDVSQNVTDYLYLSDGLSAHYVRGYIRYHSDTGEWPGMQYKNFLTAGTNEFEFGGQSGSLPSRYALYDSTGDSYMKPPSGAVQQDRWYCIELYYKTSSPAHATIWIDGVQVLDKSVSSNITMQYFSLGIINACGTSSSFSMYNWFDGFAMSTSRIYPSSTIEISNSATYHGGTYKYQEPIYLSDGSIQIKADLTGLGAGPYYLWVTNNQQQTSSSYKLSGTGTPIAAPSGLIVK